MQISPNTNESGKNKQVLFYAFAPVVRRETEGENAKNLFLIPPSYVLMPMTFYIPDYTKN